MHINYNFVLVIHYCNMYNALSTIYLYTMVHEFAFEVTYQVIITCYNSMIQLYYNKQQLL